MKLTGAVMLRHTLLLLSTLAVAACSDAPKAPEAAAAQGADASAATAASVDPAAANGVPVVTAFGVPECDAYVSKYMACVEGKVTGEAKDQLLATFEANRTKWRAMSTMREAGVALGLACKAALQKAKEELSVEYGCEF